MKIILWILEVSDNVVPGLDSLITYIQSTCTTLAALQTAITNVNNNVQTEINNLEIPNQGDLNVIKSYITTQLIHIIHSNEITQYTNMIIVEGLSHSKAISHINEKVAKSYTDNY